MSNTKETDNTSNTDNVNNAKNTNIISNHTANIIKKLPRDAGKKYFNICDPEKTLPPSDHAVVDIDVFTEKNGAEVRGDNLFRKLGDTFDFADAPTTILLSGLPGSGKSTELQRFAQMMGRGTAEQEGLGYSVLLIDAGEHLDLQDRIDVTDVLFMILFCAEKYVIEQELEAEYWNKNWGRLSQKNNYQIPAEESQKIAQEAEKRVMKVSLLSKLYNSFVGTTIEAKELDLNIGILFELKTRPSLRQRVRNAVSAQLSRVLREVSDDIKTLQERLRKAQNPVFKTKGLLIIIDSLEKLRGSPNNFDDVLASAEQLFGAGAPNLQLPVHVLYTVPPALCTRIRDTEIHFMPMIKIWERRDRSKPYEAGRKVLREMIERRIPWTDLQPMLGATEADAEASLTKIIEWSGGYPRELIRTLRNVVTEAVHSLPIRAQYLDRYFVKLSGEMEMIIPLDAVEWLAELEHQAPAGLLLSGDHDIQTANRMLANNIVMRYADGSGWWSLHPAAYHCSLIKNKLQEMQTALQIPSQTKNT